MPQTTRSQNLDLLRWLNRGHKNTAKKLASVTNSNYVSKMATGDLEITDCNARSIERAVELPAGWLDRDNVSTIKMSALQSQIHALVAALPEEKQTALLRLLAPDSP